MQPDQHLRAILASVMPGGPSDLCEFAAHHSINELICNQSKALNQGYQIDTLVKGVASVVEIFEHFKAQCAIPTRLQSEVRA